MDDDGLIAFLRARLDEDEQLAGGVLEGNAASRSGGLVSTLWDEEDARARRDLREVEAGRAILDAYTRTDGDSPRDRDRGRWDGLHAAVRHVAAVYGDHPGYRPEWKP